MWSRNTCTHFCVKHGRFNLWTSEILLVWEYHISTKCGTIDDNNNNNYDNHEKKNKKKKNKNQPHHKRKTKTKRNKKKSENISTKNPQTRRKIESQNKDRKRSTQNKKKKKKLILSFKLICVELDWIGLDWWLLRHSLGVKPRYRKRKKS